MNALPKPPPTGDEAASNVTPFRRAAVGIFTGVEEATRGLQPTDRDPDASMTDVSIPENLLADLFRNASELGVEVESPTVKDRFGFNTAVTITVVRCHGKEVYLANIPGFILDNPSTANQTAIGLLNSLFAAGTVISVICQDLPQGPHLAFVKTWDAWAATGGVRVLPVRWRDFNELAGHDYRWEDVAETLNLSEMLTPSSEEADKAGESAGTTPVRIFISYAREDDEYRAKLEENLSSLKHHKLVELWTDRCIVPGDDWDDAIDENIRTADVVLLLVSQAFVNSEYITSKELELALARHEDKKARVVPVILRPAVWDETPFARFQAIPKDALAITKWQDLDEAWVDVIKSLRAMIGELVAGRR